MKVNKKYWDKIVCYWDYPEVYKAMNEYREVLFVTRKEWDGVHYINRWGEYCILLKTGDIVVDPIEIYKKDEPDWIEVEITEEARTIIDNHSQGIFEYDLY